MSIICASYGCLERSDDRRARPGLALFGTADLLAVRFRPLSKTVHSTRSERFAMHLLSPSWAEQRAIRRIRPRLQRGGTGIVSGKSSSYFRLFPASTPRPATKEILSCFSTGSCRPLHSPSNTTGRSTSNMFRHRFSRSRSISAIGPCRMVLRKSMGSSTRAPIVRVDGQSRSSRRKKS